MKKADDPRVSIDSIGKYQKLPLDEYLAFISQRAFVACPPGGGLAGDTFRTWATLYMGSYPIVVSSGHDAQFDGLPVVIVDRWSDVTVDRVLREWYDLEAKRKQGLFHMERLWFPYWANMIAQKMGLSHFSHIGQI